MFDSVTPWTAAQSLPALHCLLEFAQTHVHWVSDAIQPSHPLSLLFPFALNPSSIRVFSNESALRIRWPKYWKFSFSISPSNEYSGLISFRIDWIDLLQATLKSLLQHHNLTASILWTFLMVQLLYSYMAIGKPQLWLHGPLSAKCFPLIKKKKKKSWGSNAGLLCSPWILASILRVALKLQNSCLCNSHHIIVLGSKKRWGDTGGPLDVFVLYVAWKGLSSQLGPSVLATPIHRRPLTHQAKGNTVDSFWKVKNHVKSES